MTIRFVRPILYFFCPSLRVSYFTKEPWFFFFGAWYLETKIWALEVLIDAGVSLFYRTEVSNMCICSNPAKHTSVMFLTLITKIFTLTFHSCFSITFLSDDEKLGSQILFKSSFRIVVPYPVENKFIAGIFCLCIVLFAFIFSIYS